MAAWLRVICLLSLQFDDYFPVVYLLFLLFCSISSDSDDSQFPLVFRLQVIHREFITAMAMLLPKVQKWGDETLAKAKIGELYRQCFTFNTTVMRLAPYEVWRRRSRWGFDSICDHGMGMGMQCSEHPGVI